MWRFRRLEQKIYKLASFLVFGQLDCIHGRSVDREMGTAEVVHLWYHYDHYSMDYDNRRNLSNRLHTHASQSMIYPLIC